MVPHNILRHEFVHIILMYSSTAQIPELNPPHGSFNTDNSSVFERKKCRTRQNKKVTDPFHGDIHLPYASQEAACFMSQRR
jgi:hypothetical protein